MRAVALDIAQRLPSTSQTIDGVLATKIDDSFESQHPNDEQPA